MIKALAKTMLLIATMIVAVSAVWVPFNDIYDYSDIYCSESDYAHFAKNYVTKFSCTRTGGGVTNVGGVSRIDGNDYKLKGENGWCKAYTSSVSNYLCREIRERLDRRDVDDKLDEVVSILNKRQTPNGAEQQPAWGFIKTENGRRYDWLDKKVKLQIIDNVPTIVSGDEHVSLDSVQQVFSLAYNSETGLYSKANGNLKYTMTESTISFPEDLGHLESYGNSNRVDNFAKVFGSLLSGWTGDSHTDVDNRKIESAGDNGFLAITNGDRAANANVDCVEANWEQHLPGGVGVPGGAVCIRVESQKKERGWTFAYGGNEAGVKDIGCNSYDAKISYVQGC